MAENREQVVAEGFVAVGGPAAFRSVCQAATDALVAALLRLLSPDASSASRPTFFAELAARAVAVVVFVLAAVLMLTPAQAAKRAGVSPSLIYQLCAGRRLPHYRIGGEGRRGKVLIDEQDLEAFLATCRVTDDPLMDESDLRHIR